MAAPIGNQFWKIAGANIGRKMEFTPEELWEESCGYFKWCDENPIMSYEWNGKDPQKCELEFARAYTLKGLCVYLGVNEKYFNETVAEKEEYSHIVTRIRYVIFTQKFELAAAGLLKENIISRELGLVEKQDLQIDGSAFNIVIDGNMPNKDNEPT